MTNFTLAGYQSFTLDKSLIKKIFSWKETSKERDRTFYEKDGSEDSISYNYNKKQRQLKETIMSRHVFRYTWTQLRWKEFKDRVRCIFCCGFVTARRCCCCERKGRSHRSAAKKEDRLYAEGLSKLYLEIDLLEVVKQLRISRFMSSIFLTANQRELIKFQKSYALGLKNYNRKRGGAGGQGASRRFLHVERVENRIDSVEYMNMSGDSGFKAMPAPKEALLDFNPDDNNIDGNLFENIVDYELLDDFIDAQSEDLGELNSNRSSYRENVTAMDDRQANKKSFSDDSVDDSDDDEAETESNIRGFNTNMDDYLNNFGSFDIGGENTG